MVRELNTLLPLEASLSDYSTTGSMLYGLTNNTTRSPFFDMADANKIDVPRTRKDNRQTGIVWWEGFFYEVVTVPIGRN